MLINNEKTTININEPMENYWLVDENTEDGKQLAQKIIYNYPYFDFIFDNEGNLIDITPAERPEPEPIIPGPNLEEKLELKIAQNTVETLELISALNEIQRLEQAQANAELIELMLSLQGGMM